MKAFRARGSSSSGWLRVETEQRKARDSDCVHQLELTPLGALQARQLM